MKREKIAIIILMCLSIIIPFLVYSIIFPNIYFGTKIANIDSTNDFSLELEEKMPKLMKKYQLSGGVAISLISNYEIAWIGKYGLANEELEIPVTNDTYFQIASMSKTFCAWGVMKLYDNGLIDLDDPVDDYLTRWNLPDTGYNNSKVTIRRILSHTAGLSLPSFLGYATADELPTIEEELTANVKVIKEPGSSWMYSGGGFLVLQLLIEEVSGLTYSDYITDEILIPLNLTNTRPDWTTDIRSSTATAYDPFGNVIPTYRFTALSAGGKYSTIIDLSKFVLANMEGPEGQLPGRGILNESTIEIMQTRVADVHPYMGGYGLGFQMKILSNGQKMVYHNGQNTGFIGTMNFIPENGEGLVVLTNCDSAKSLVVEIESKWQQMNQGTTKKTLLFTKYLINIPVIIVLVSAFISINIWMVVSIYKNNRKLTFHKNISRIIGAIILGITLIIVNTMLYAPITYRSGFVFVYWFVPEMHWLLLLFSMSILYYIVITLTFCKKIKTSIVVN